LREMKRLVVVVRGHAQRYRTLLLPSAKISIPLSGFPPQGKPRREGSLHAAKPARLPRKRVFKSLL
jgi:hypothetical protein